MSWLLDTHSLAWFAFDDQRLPANAKAIIEDPVNTILVSPASYWEIAIKVSLGKWTLQVPYPDLMDSLWTVYGFQVLPILPSHTLRLLTLPHPSNHRDPFDRLLVAQSLVEGIPLISEDTKLDQYGVTRVWA